MKKKLLIALAVLAGLILIFVIVVALQPGHYRIQRSAVIHAPPAKVFSQVNDFHRWEAWSPWSKLDPHAQNTFSGPAAGNGAMFAWDGNDDVGQGSMTILASRPDEAIQIQLAFVRPFEDTCTVDFHFEPAADGTQVAWTMQGEKGFVGKLFSLFMDMDSMIGGDFERGLANLEQVCTASAAPQGTPAAPPENAPAPVPSPAPVAQP